MSKKKTGTDMIRPVPDGVKMAARMHSDGYGHDTGFGVKEILNKAFLAGVNHVLTLNGHKPMKL